MKMKTVELDLDTANLEDLVKVWNKIMDRCDIQVNEDGSWQLKLKDIHCFH